MECKEGTRFDLKKFSTLDYRTKGLLDAQVAKRSTEGNQIGFQTLDVNLINSITPGVECIVSVGSKTRESYQNVRLYFQRGLLMIICNSVPPIYLPSVFQDALYYSFPTTFSSVESIAPLISNAQLYNNPNYSEAEKMEMRRVLKKDYGDRYFVTDNAIHEECKLEETQGKFF